MHNVSWPAVHQVESVPAHPESPCQELGRACVSSLRVDPPEEAVLEVDELDAENDAVLWKTSVPDITVASSVAVPSAKQALHHAVETIAQAYLKECQDMPGKTQDVYLEKLLFQLPFQYRHAPRQANEEQHGKTNSLVFGLYQHGSVIGVTAATHHLPKVVSLINCVLKKQLPSEAMWTSVQVSFNATVSPHRDSRNTGVSFLRAFGEFDGGRLWVEVPDGQTPIRWKDGEIHYGELYPTKGHWLRLRAKELLHAVETFVGTRVSISVCTAGTGKLVTRELAAMLSTKGFQLPDTHLGVDQVHTSQANKKPVELSTVVKAFEESGLATSDDEARICFGPLALDVEARDEHARCGHVPARPDCEACQE